MSAMEHPRIDPVRADAIPDELTTYPHWVCWRWKWSRNDWTKVPVNPHTGALASSTDSATWGTFEQAIDWSRRHHLAGVGFMFSSDNPFAGVDLDDCYDPATGALLPWAARIVQQLDSYTEVSPSGKGLKIFVRGSLPGSRHKAGDIEMYECARYFTVTGRHLPRTPLTIEERSTALASVYRETFKTEKPANTNPAPTPLTSILSDADILNRAMRAKNGQKFSRLWAGDATGYPSPSEADLALCSLLAFWTGPNETTIDRLFRQSGLYREKWEREDYRSATIIEALDRTEFWEPAEAEPPHLHIPRDPDTGDEPAKEHPFSLIPFNQLDSMPDPKQLVRGLLQAGTVAVVYGDGGSYKSFLALDIALHVVNGEQWCGRAVEQAQIIYVAAEGAAGIKKRRKAWELAHELPSDGAWLLPNSLQLMDSQHIEGFIEALQSQEIHPGLIVIDTLSQNSLGADENSSHEMAVAIDTAQRLATVFNAVVLIVHHSNKIGGFRGASSIRDNVQTFMAMNRDERTSLATLKCEKNRDLEPFDTITFSPQQIIVKPGAGLIPPETSLVLELADDAAKVKRTLSPDNIVNTLRRLGWSSSEDLAREFDVSDRHVRRALSELLGKEFPRIKIKKLKSGRVKRNVYAVVEEDDDSPVF